ncbi:transposase [Paraburkholderia sp. GAS38]|jgi:transposase|uniref:transposase n=1 Tax=Paraburkholderia sp. GAS38 TaxID=3035133 RepID=UPI003D1A3F4A
MISLPLSDSAWSRVEHLFPDVSAGRGRPRRNERDILNAILWLQQTGEKWHRLPGTFPPQQTCYQRYILWKKLGILLQVAALLDAAEQDASPASSEGFDRGDSGCSAVASTRAGARP